MFLSYSLIHLIPLFSSFFNDRIPNLTFHCNNLIQNHYFLYVNKKIEKDFLLKFQFYPFVHIYFLYVITISGYIDYFRCFPYTFTRRFGKRMRRDVYDKKRIFLFFHKYFTIYRNISITTEIEKTPDSDNCLTSSVQPIRKDI